MDVCCNALYGSPDQSPGHHNNQGDPGMFSMAGVSQQHFEDFKENLSPFLGDATSCLWAQFDDAVHTCATGVCQSSESPADAGQYGPRLQIARASCNSPAPLQPLLPEQPWQNAVLLVPSSSGVSQNSSQMLSQQSNHLASHHRNESVSQPAADVCLFGSPPRQSQNAPDASWHMPAASTGQPHKDGRWASTHTRDRHAVQGLHAGQPHDAALDLEEEAGVALALHESSEQAFRQLLKSAQQQRVSNAMPCFCTWTSLASMLHPYPESDCILKNMGLFLCSEQFWCQSLVLSAIASL